MCWGCSLQSTGTSHHRLLQGGDTVPDGTAVCQEAEAAGIYQLRWPRLYHSPLRAQTSLSLAQLTLLVQGLWLFQHLGS